MQKEAQSQRREAAEKKWRDRKADDEKSKRGRGSKRKDGDGADKGERDDSPPFIPERDTQRGNSPPIPAMRKGGSGRGNGQPGSNGHDTFESDPDIGSDAGASGAGLTTSEDEKPEDTRRQSEVWEG